MNHSVRCVVAASPVATRRGRCRPAESISTGRPSEPISACLLPVALCLQLALAPPAFSAVLGNVAEKDPVRAFELFGFVSKKFLIEVLEGEKVVRRQKGISVEACVTAIITPESQLTGQGSLRRGTEQAQQACALKTLPGAFTTSADFLRPVCVPACRDACAGGLENHAAFEKALTGFAMEADDEAKVFKSCVRSCAVECTKPGKTFDWETPWRPT